MLRTFLRLVDRGCDLLTLLALPVLALLWLTGLGQLLREHLAAAGTGELAALWRHGAALYMAAIARSFTRDRALLHADTLLADWRAAGRERLRRLVSALCVLPWCAYVLWAGAPTGRLPALPAVSFPAPTPGELALLQTLLWSSALVLALHALLDIFAPRRPRGEQPADRASLL